MTHPNRDNEYVVPLKQLTGVRRDIIISIPKNATDEEIEEAIDRIKRLRSTDKNKLHPVAQEIK